MGTEVDYDALRSVAGDTSGETSVPPGVRDAIKARTEALKRWLVRLVVSPNVGLRDGQLVGVTYIVNKNCPASALLGDQRAILDGYATYGVKTPPGSEEELLKLRNTLPTAIVEDAGASEFDLHNPGAEWTPSLGQSPQKSVSVGYQRKDGKQAYSLFVHANAERAAGQLLQYIKANPALTVKDLLESKEYARLLVASQHTRNRLALAAAHALKLNIAQANMSAGPGREYAGGVPSSETTFNSLRRIDGNQEPIYGYYSETTPTSSVGKGSNGLLLKHGHFGGWSSFTGSQTQSAKPWKNSHYDTFPVNTGLGTATSYGRLTGDDAEKARDRITWGSRHPFNPALHEVVRPWKEKRFRKSLHKRLGHAKDMRRDDWELILAMIPRPNEDAIEPAHFLSMTPETQGELDIPIGNPLVGMIAERYRRVKGKGMGGTLAEIYGKEGGGYICIPRALVQLVLSATE